MLNRLNVGVSPAYLRLLLGREKFATFATVILRLPLGAIVRAILKPTSMSKGNMLLGHARGKVGDLVFARVNGQQVTRARAAVVKNPQTEQQMIQRILLNTVIQAYARMAEICDHSFEGVAVGQKSMNKFMKENLNNLRKKVAEYANAHGSFDGLYAFSPKGLNNFTPNEWVLSSGQLPEVTLANIAASTGAEITIVSAEAIPTYAEIIASLGLQRGDQLTFIGQELYTDGRAAFKFARVILDPREQDGTQADISTPFLVEGSVNKPSPRNEGADISFSSAANKLIFDLGASSMFGAAVIVSRQKNDGSWLRSNAAMQLDAALPYALTGAMDLQEALDYSYSGSLDLESERYLNNATKGSKIVAPQPEPTPGTPRLISVTAGGTPITKGSSVNHNAGNIPFVAQAADLVEGTTYSFVASNVTKQVGQTITITAANSANFSDGSASKTVELEQYGQLTLYLCEGTTVIEVWATLIGPED